MLVERNGKLGATSFAGIGMILAGTFAMLLAGLGVSTAGATQPNPEHQVTLCHRTDSYTNPYREITVDVASVLNTEGHDSHDGRIFFPDIPKHEQWGDIIPPFDFGPGEQYAGQNYGTDGQAILAAGCTVASVTATTAELTTTTEGSTESTTTTTVGSSTTGAATTTTTDESTTTEPGQETTTSGNTNVTVGGVTTGSSTVPIGGLGTPGGVVPGAADNGSGDLPFTGSPVGMLLGVGLALIASGFGLVVRRRRMGA
jgi:LPXTG-motif cell wall-anchored protein